MKIHKIEEGTKVTTLKRIQSSGSGAVNSVTEKDFIIKYVCNEEQFTLVGDFLRSVSASFFYKIDGVVIESGDTIEVLKRITSAGNKCKIGDVSKNPIIRHLKVDNFKESVIGETSSVIVENYTV